MVALVAVFAEARRVLAPHGTCWLNLGDSYAATRSYQVRDSKHTDVGNTMPAAVPEGLKAKDLVGIPWRVAFALQEDGWWLRSDIIWAKPNPMPESVTDRPTKSHEYVFLLTKAPRYYFDAEAVREDAAWERWGDQTNRKHEGQQSAAGWIGDKSKRELVKRRTVRPGIDVNGGNQGAGEITLREGQGRNVRSVWQIPTQPYPEAHFAVFPEELARRCILAGCPERVCRLCGKPSERVVERESSWPERRDAGGTRGNVAFDGKVGAGTQRGVHGDGVSHDLGGGGIKTLGWTDCGCTHEFIPDEWRPGVVLDPFVGSGTTCKAARDHARHSIGIDLNSDYLALAARRLQQQSLFA